jgi:hypothetical protein
MFSNMKQNSNTSASRMEALEVRKKSKPYCVQLQAQHGLTVYTVYGENIA